ncbi:hypothetical protein SXCC_00844 [Gluconacetobacter sp. SXCC-1]|nr:hypothetical protein SXCC_00844 [Gluconacetobacter sp. SXCC-1]
MYLPHRNHDVRSQQVKTASVTILYDRRKMLLKTGENNTL